MAKTYSKKDIFDGKLFDEAINEANQMIKVLEVMDTKIIQLSNTYKNTLNNATTSNKKGIEDIIKVSNELNVVTDQANKIEKDKIDTSEKLRKAELEQAKAYEQFTKEVQKRQAIEEKAHAKREQQYNKEIQQNEKLAQKEAERTSKLERNYNKVQIALNAVSQKYQDLAIKKEMGDKLSAKEEMRLNRLQALTLKYDTALRRVDGGMNKWTRNVGNYANAYNGLGMSVSQLAREMPAFANSVGTGFMAISNNLPMFFDEITKIKNANKELVASGKPTTSVFKQLASSIFSVSTLLSIGVTLLTVYGAKLFEMFTGEENVNKLLEKRKEIQKRNADDLKKYSEGVGREITDIKALSKAIKEAEPGSKKRAELIQVMNDKYGTHLKNIQDESLFTKQLNEEVNNYVKLAKERIRINLANERATNLLSKEVELRSKAYQLDKKAGDISSFASKNAQGIYEIHKDDEQISIALLSNEEQKAKLAEREDKRRRIEYANESEKLKERANYAEWLADKNLTYVETNDKVVDGSGKITKNTKSTYEHQKDLNTELEKTNEYMSKTVELQDKVTDKLEGRGVSLIQKQLDAEFEAQKENADLGWAYSILKIDELIDLKEKLMTEHEKRLTAIQIRALKERADEETKAELEALEKRYTELVNQENITEEAKAQIRAQYEADKIVIDNNDIKRKEDVNKEAEALEIDLQDRITVIEEEAQKDRIQKRIELNDLSLKHDEETKRKEEEIKKKAEEEEKKRFEEEKKRAKERQKLRQDIVNQTIDEMKRISNEKEALLDKEIEAEKKQQDALQAQANAGNIDAQNSIKASIEAQKQATVEKQKEVDKQRRYDELKMLYNLIEAKIEKGDGAIQATGKSMAEMAIIKGAAKLLSGFKKGTKKRVQDEMKPNVDLGSDPDNRIIRVAGDEAILTGEKMDLLEKFGIHTTDDIVNNAIKAKVNIKQDVAGNSYDLLALQGKLDAIEKAILNKPETNIELGLITQNAMEIIERRTQGNKTTTNAFKVK